MNCNCIDKIRNTAPGSKQVVKVPITTDLGDLNIDLAIHVVAGAKPGPTLALLSALHGSEWQSVEILRRFLRQIDPAQVSGTILALPVGNPVSLCYQTRNVPDESDSSDVNRSFSSVHTWIADQLAQAITRTVLEPADAMIDMHIAPFGSAMAATMYPVDLSSETTISASREMAKVFGVGCVQKGRVLTEFPGPRSSFGYCGGVLDIPCIGVELGGLGWDLAVEEGWINTNVRGCFNVMKHLGMLAGDPEVPDKTLVFEKRFRVNPRVGGILLPGRDRDELLRFVGNGEVLGRVVSAATFEELEVLVSPCDGYLFGIARSYPVRPGDWCFLVADGEDEDTRWVNTSDL